MKYLIFMLFSTLIFFSCFPTEESDDSIFQKDNFITIEATVINDTANTAIPTWYNGTYLPKIMEYSGLKGVRRVKTIVAVPLPPTSPSVDFLPGYLTIFMAETKDELMGLSGSTQAGEANSSMATQFPDNEIVRSWNVSYEKLKSWENEGADQPMQFITMVSTVASAGNEDAVNNWENTKHVPDHMQSQNLSRVVRYKKIDGTGANVSGMPKYIEIFYYADQAKFEAHNPGSDPIFAAAEEDRANTWKNGELDIPWVYSGAIDKEIGK